MSAETYGLVRFQFLSMRHYVAYLDSVGLACMHVLRSSYLPLYASLIQPPYTTDPFPASTPTSASSVALTSIQRETAVLDMFIRLKVEEDVRADESELYLDQGHFADLFNLLQVRRRPSIFKTLITYKNVVQPRSRLEDLVRKYGSRAGLISNSTHSAPPVVPFSSISVTWGLRVVGIAATDSRGRKRTIVQVSREKGESLEIIAKRLVREWGKGVKG